MTPTALHDGVAVDAAVAGNRGLHYGDGVFRTLLCSGGQAVDWPLHLDKLRADCCALGFAPPVSSALEDDLRRLVPPSGDVVVKILAVRSAGTRGYVPQVSQAERWVLSYPAPPVDAAPYRSGIEAIVSPVILSEQPLLAGIKHLNRLEQVLASRDWPAGVQEALMCDAAGRPICGTRSNLFLVRGGRLQTPQLDRCGVAGIMRRKILGCCPALGIGVDEIPLTAAALRTADEAFVCNAIIGLWPLRRLQDIVWSAPGPLTRRLMQHLQHPRIPSVT